MQDGQPCGATTHPESLDLILAAQSASSSGSLLADGSLSSMPSRARSQPAHQFHPHRKKCPSNSAPHPSQPHGNLHSMKSSPMVDNAYTWAKDAEATPSMVGSHTLEWVATAAAWKTLLPKLVYPFMQWQEMRMNKPKPLNNEWATPNFSDCHRGSLQAEVSVMSFMSRFQVILFNLIGPGTHSSILSHPKSINFLLHKLHTFGPVSSPLRHFLLNTNPSTKVGL